jgi:hypothetical protein
MKLNGRRRKPGSKKRQRVLKRKRSRGKRKNLRVERKSYFVGKWKRSADLTTSRRSNRRNFASVKKK